MGDPASRADYDTAPHTGGGCLVNHSGLRHRLMAILCADASGYSRRMAQDERATVAELVMAETAWWRHRRKGAASRPSAGSYREPVMRVGGVDAGGLGHVGRTSKQFIE